MNIGLEVSLEVRDCGQPSNVSRQVIPRLWSSNRKISRSEGSAYARFIESPFWTVSPFTQYRSMKDKRTNRRTQNCCIPVPIPHSA